MKLLFVSNNYHIGGIQKSLMNLLREISSRHDVTLFLFYPEGELKEQLPEGVKVISGNRFTRILGMSQEEAGRTGKMTLLWRSFWVIVTRLLGTRVSYGLLAGMQKLPGEYDAGISFSQNSANRMFYGGCNEFTHRAVKAKKKYSFVHCDFRNYPGNHPYNRSYYRHFDAIACVSDSCKRIFDEVCPEYEQKTVAVHNCYDFGQMEAMANAAPAERTPDAVNLITAARISEEKGIFRMFPILCRLKEEGFSFVWRIAGDGPLYSEAVEECRRYRLEDRVIFLGMTQNVYPYFKSADLLLVPSYNEAAPMVFGEAAYFGLPILATDTVSAAELVGDTGAGVVCANDDAAIEEKLRELLSRPDAIRVPGMNASNRQAMDELEQLLKR